MPTFRNLALGLGAALAAASLTVAGTAATYASQARPDSTTTTSHGVVPDPNAPHVGNVAGLQTGPDISIRNPHSVHAFRVLHASMLRTAASGRTSGKTAPTGRPQTIHEYVGTSFDTDTMGSQASQSVSTKIKPGNPGTTLYTPTMYPSGGSSAGSCIEMSTAYFYSSQVVAAWDWCKAITFVAQVTIDKSFMKTYTKHHYYSTQIKQTDAASNTWTSYLYNYKKGTWEKFFSQSGTSQVGLAEGWDIYELYSELKGDGQSYACDDLQGKRVAAKGIKVGVDGTWVTADPSHAAHDYDVPLSEFHCDSLTYNMITPYSHWKAIG
jgi:hypothetical protein